MNLPISQIKLVLETTKTLVIDYSFKRNYLQLRLIIIISLNFLGLRVVGETSISQNYAVIMRNFVIITRNFNFKVFKISNQIGHGYSIARIALKIFSGYIYF